jgi:hypothetical protein
MIQRIIEEQINSYLKSKEKKILFIWGPRRSGKTTLLGKYTQLLKEKSFNFDYISDQEMFVPDREKLEKIVAEHKVILIDEVQNYPGSTTVLKLLHDEFNIKIIATGSSELRQKGQDFESLAGRYIEAFCLPLSIEEIVAHKQPKPSTLPKFEKLQAENFMKWGSYPEIFLFREDADKIIQLENIFNTYVLKDVVSIYDLKDTKLAKDILQKIALQIGCEVSLREIANSLQANIGTVSNYIEIFVKNHILIQMPAFKANARRAVSENKKYYFLDLGIRNALVKDFRDLDLRPDNGNVFENFIISEIVKKKKNNNLLLNLYFYREYSGREIDLVIEDYQKKYRTYEIKLSKGASKSFFPFMSVFDSINIENYFEKIEGIPNDKAK